MESPGIIDGAEAQILEAQGYPCDPVILHNRYVDNGGNVLSYNRTEEQGNVKVMLGKKGGVAGQEKEGVGIGKNEQRHEKMTNSGIKDEGIPTCLEWAWEIRDEMGRKGRYKRRSFRARCGW